MKLTPASAGNTQGPSANSALPRVHPRLREEHERSCTLVPAPIGSPPLTQGMQDHLRHRKDHVRITPALQGASPVPHSKKTPPKSPQISQFLPFSHAQPLQILSKLLKPHRPRTLIHHVPQVKQPAEILHCHPYAKGSGNIVIVV